MIGIFGHYVRRKYIYSGNLAYQGRRARRGNVGEPVRHLGPLTPALSIETRRLPDKLQP